MSESRIRGFPVSAIDKFFQHMADSGSSAWVWTFIEMTSRNGICHITPDTVLLARPVHSSTSEEDVLMFNDLDPLNEEHKRCLVLTERYDSWHILYASGDPYLFFELCPYPLKSVTWHRNKGDNRLRSYNFDKLKQRFHG